MYLITFKKLNIHGRCVCVGGGGGTGVVPYIRKI